VRHSSFVARAAGAVLLCSGAALACAGPTPARLRVEIRDLAFEPSKLPVEPGDTVTWINLDIVPHTVTGVGSALESGPIPPGASFTWIVAVDGSLHYACSYHPTMTGELEAR